MTTSPLAELSTHVTDLIARIDHAATLADLQVDEPFIIGKRSILSTLQKSLGALAPGGTQGRRCTIARGPS